MNTDCVAWPRLGHLLAATLLTCATTVTLADTPTPAAAFQPSASIAEIMESIVMPAADVLWNAVSVDVTAEAVVEKRPESQADWDALRWSAVNLAEAANLVVIPGRHAAPPDAQAEALGDELDAGQIEALLSQQWPAWVAHAQALHSVAMQAVAAIDAQDVERLNEVGGSIDAACESCHLQFWYPEQH